MAKHFISFLYVEGNRVGVSAADLDLNGIYCGDDIKDIMASIADAHPEYDKVVVVSWQRYDKQEDIHG